MSQMFQKIGAEKPPRVPVKGGVEYDGKWLFASGPYYADQYGAKIWGKDFDGNECMVLDVRGWGYLTGHGRALRMPQHQAVEAQKAMGDFVADAMNKALGYKPTNSSEA